MTLVDEKEDLLASWCRRLKASDEAAFTELFHVLYPDLLWYARHRVRNDDVAEDLVQEAFLRLWHKRASLNPERSVRAFLFVTVRHLAFNVERNTATRTSLLDMRDTPHPPSAPDTIVEAQRVDHLLRGWIQELPARRREAFELSRFGGLSYPEIARVMELSHKTVEKHITGALKQLRDRLRAYDPDLLRP